MKNCSARARRRTALVFVLLLLAGGVAWYLSRLGTVRLPVLTYHHFAAEADNDMIVTPERFEEHLRTLAEHGWHSVTIAQIIDYAERGTALPDKPFLITFDDGYASNLDLAAPLLERYGFHAVIFVIGVYADGQDVDPRTGWPVLPPHFSLEEATPWIESGVIELQSHTWDMHRQRDGGQEDGDRKGMLPIDGESDEDYLAALREDCARERELFLAALGEAPTALGYPFGAYTEQTDRCLESCGIRVTFTGGRGASRLRAGDTATLRELRRITVKERMDGEVLLWRMSAFKGPRGAVRYLRSLLA